MKKKKKRSDLDRENLVWAVVGFVGIAIAVALCFVVAHHFSESIPAGYPR